MAVQAAKRKRGKKNFRGKLPTKRSINLVLADEKKLSIPKAVIGIIAIVVIAGVFSKYLVVDRLTAMSQAESLAGQKKADLERLYSLLKEYGGVEEEYAHYTRDGMTREELSRVDRTKILALAGNVLRNGMADGTWVLTGNVLTLEMTGSSLTKLNKLARKIEQEDIVDSCTIMNVTKNDEKKASAGVRGKFIIYLQQPPEEEEGEEP